VQVILLPVYINRPAINAAQYDFRNAYNWRLSLGGQLLARETHVKSPWTLNTTSLHRPPSTVPGQIELEGGPPCPPYRSSDDSASPST